mmetsp:Transcript_39873/g.83369  ORF Transcript_39873/g.83369 Transcript_39873/m.83369 type:complete len:201 (-) Transcript_39873:1402-2004(-)
MVFWGPFWRARGISSRIDADGHSCETYVSMRGVRLSQGISAVRKKTEARSRGTSTSEFERPCQWPPCGARTGEALSCPKAPGFAVVSLGALRILEMKSSIRSFYFSGFSSRVLQRSRRARQVDSSTGYSIARNGRGGSILSEVFHRRIRNAVRTQCRGIRLRGEFARVLAVVQNDDRTRHMELALEMSVCGRGVLLVGNI